MIHSMADVQSKNIGKGTNVWQFCVVLSDAKIGAECNICANVFIENDVIIGDNVTIKSGVQLWDGITLENDVFIGPNVTFTNDNFPRSKQVPAEFLRTVIRKDASIGANSTILPGLEVGRNAMVGAGSVVTKSVPANAIVVGSPARIIGYVEGDRQRIQPQKEVVDSLGDATVKVGGAILHKVSVVTDLRGSLSFAEYSQHLPFIPKRYFTVFDVPGREVRGEHAHRDIHQFLVLVKGSCSVVVDDGKSRVEVILDNPGIGLHIPPMVWGIQYNYSKDAVLLVLASDCYNPDEYIRDYDEFLELTAK